MPPLFCGCAYAATDLKDATNSEGMGKFFAGDATIVLGDNGGCAYAATDLKDAMNSKGIAEHTDARAFREIDVDEVFACKGPRGSYQCPVGHW